MHRITRNRLLLVHLVLAESLIFAEMRPSNNKRTLSIVYLLSLQGEFYNIAHPVEAPFTPPSLPPITGNTSMLYMWLTDYMADTAGFVYQTAGLLHYTITPSMVPPSLPFHLNTSSFRAILPQVNMNVNTEVIDLTLVSGNNFCNIHIYTYT